MVVRDARPSDLAAIREILEDCVTDSTSGAPIASVVDENLASVSDTFGRQTARRYLVAALPDGHVVGIAGLQSGQIASELFTDDEHPVEVVMTYVRQSHRRMGVGQSLIREVEAAATAMGFTTLLVVSGSRNREHGYSFWRRLYGQPHRWDEDYFGPGQERVVWRSSLKATAMRSDAVPPLE